MDLPLPSAVGTIFAVFFAFAELPTTFSSYSCGPRTCSSLDSCCQRILNDGSSFYYCCSDGGGNGRTDSWFWNRWYSQMFGLMLFIFCMLFLCSCCYSRHRQRQSRSIISRQRPRAVIIDASHPRYGTIGSTTAGRPVPSAQPSYAYPPAQGFAPPGYQTEAHQPPAYGTANALPPKYTPAPEQK